MNEMLAIDPESKSFMEGMPRWPKKWCLTLKKWCLTLKKGCLTPKNMQIVNGVKEERSSNLPNLERDGDKFIYVISIFACFTYLLTYVHRYIV